MSLKIFGGKSSTPDSVSNNIKLAIATSVFHPNLKFVIDIEGSGNILLQDAKTGFEIFEPNAIVKTSQMTWLTCH
ncbi:unnamed protein product [Ambrosiozyma monospora]|uniref:Unnamed protein product n=1 Tax=Ambrosiozyma monospora TaxID=43982 RepID=A0ACB5T9K8_AMBMO|nr:unnamed protein product [Ambrosiozyma monospora]